VKEIEGTITHLNLEDRLALAAYKANRPIPPNVISRLQQLGLIKETPILVEGTG
jgi:hypothetical protein